MNIDFGNDEILFLEGETGTVGIVKVAYENKMLFIATQDNEEIVQFLESDDIIAVSNFNTLCFDVFQFAVCHWRHVIL